MGLSGDTRVLGVLCLVALAVLAGCAGFGGDEPDRPAVFENTTASLDEETASAFEAALTDDGKLTADAEAFLDRLAEVERVGPEQRDAVARSVAADGLDEETVARLDRMLNSTTAVQRTVLRYGLGDDNDDGLLDGEVALLGLPADRSYPGVGDAATQLRVDGHDAADIAFLEAVVAVENDEFARTQARTFGLVAEPVANGSATRADRRRLTDGSGDGLLNGTAERLGINPGATHPDVAGLARPLADEPYTGTELAYLRRTAALRNTTSGWTQAEALGLLAATAEGGEVTRAEVRALNDSDGDGLLDGLAAELGVGPATDNGTVSSLVDGLAPGGLDDADLAFLDRAAAVTADNVSVAQARSLDLLVGPTRDGSATPTDRAALSDTAGDGLLDGFAAEVGLNPDEAYPTVSDLAAPLAQGGYDETAFAYLERVEELTEYQGHEYELWTQAGEVGLLDSAVANGTVTERQVWALGNDDTDRLLNGVETDFGTDPARADTSGDGYADHLVWGPLRDLGLDVTPGEPDVHVELEATSDQHLPSERQRETVREAFAAAPTPINVHFYECTTDQDPVDGPDEMHDRVDEYRTMTGIGAHYLLISDGPYRLSGGDAAGIAYVANHSASWMLVDGSLATRAGSSYESSAIAHELGHSLGILGSDYEGVDSRDVPASEYRSVMNYNNWTPVTFSDGAPFDDFDHMADQEFGSYHQDTDALAEMWTEGSVDERVTC
jgi:hypothetical protein